MNRVRIATITCALIGAFLWGCGEQAPPTVVQIGTRAITAEDLRSYVLGLNESQRSRQEGPAARREYLQPLIDYHLMWLEAQALGLDTAAAVQRQLERRIRRHLVALYLKRKPVQPPLVEEDEIKQRFERKDLHRTIERMTWGIMAKARPELEQAVAALAAGTPFGEVAARYSITPDAVNGGELGWLRVESIRRMGLPDSLFYDLPLGVLSPVLPHSAGFCVVRFTEERPVSYFDFRDEILQELQEERLGEARTARAEQLADKYDWNLHEPGLHLLLEKGQPLAALELTPEEKRTPLFKFAGGQVPLGELLDQLKNRNINALADSAALVQLAERFLLQPYLFAAAARHEELIDREALEAVRQQLREEVVLSQLRQQRVVASITIAPEAVRRYYDEQTERFRRRDQIDVAEVLVETEEEALAVRRQIEAGADIVALAQERSKRRGARARSGIFPMEKTSDLVPHILAAQPGELVGPVQVHDGFSVFEIVRRQQGERMPFAQVRRQINDMLRRAEERERFQAYIETLRQQYADQIQVDQQQLAAALPDDFLTAF
ncbi:MAG: peptidyl-prolyl cis-trans isomerase [Gemmatimonadetes bacterium]|nr:peptidyl-prolyl cis-trans isomerase [Gemmatimonadota bacterium]